MEALPGVVFIEGDFRENTVLEQLMDVLGGARADLVLSDMAPNMTGMRTVDLARAAYLAELALDLTRQVLAPGGSVVVKTFGGSGFEEFLRTARRAFARVDVRKPKASRTRSPETYVVGTGFRALPEPADGNHRG
jgi:23S rRNA (uridine2552-2'-O)-methyltransferase